MLKRVRMITAILQLAAALAAWGSHAHGDHPCRGLCETLDSHETTLDRLEAETGRCVACDYLLDQQAVATAAGNHFALGVEVLVFRFGEPMDRPAPRSASNRGPPRR